MYDHEAEYQYDLDRMTAIADTLEGSGDELVIWVGESTIIIECDSECVEFTRVEM